LRQNGVNPDAFVQSALAGNINDANDVLREMGRPQVSGDDLAKGMALADQKMSGELGKVPSAQLEVDEGAKGGPGGAAGAGGGASGFASSMDGDAFQGGQGAYLVENHGPAGAGAALGANGAGAEGEGSDAAKNSMLSALGFKFGGEEAAEAGGGKGFNRQTLLNLGILPKQPKQNIFQIAHRNYRSYQKWRQSHVTPRVAQK
jgi:hypothetical protein